MRGDNDSLVLSTTTDELTGEQRPLLQIPVQVCNAVSSTGDVRFDVAAPSGAPRKTMYVDEATGEKVEDDECPRGVRVGDQFVPVPDEQREAITDATKLSYMRVAGHAPIDDLMRDYGHLVKGAYFLQPPAKGSPKAYRLAYEALLPQRTARGKIIAPALGITMKRTAKTRQRASIVYASETHRCLMLLDVAFPSDVREPDAQVLSHLAAEVSDAQVENARTLIEAMPDASEFLTECIDDTREQRQELIDQVLAGEAIEVPTKAVAESVEEDNLEALLEASIAAVGAR